MKVQLCRDLWVSDLLVKIMQDAICMGISAFISERMQACALDMVEELCHTSSSFCTSPSESDSTGPAGADPAI
jgi:hypothetical protein